MGNRRQTVNVVNDLDTTLAPDALTLANELRPILLRLNRELRREALSLGISAGQATLLRTIERTPGIGVCELAAGEGVSPAVISVHVRHLVEAGLVERSAGEDRRRVGLTVTAAGRRILQSVRSRRNAWLAARLQALDPDDLHRLEEALEPLGRVLDAA
jgi:DNA-binding MarR family transcriptional regulator